MDQPNVDGQRAKLELWQLCAELPHSGLYRDQLPNQADAALGGERGHLLALYRAVPGPSCARRLRAGAGQLRGVSALFWSKIPGMGRRAVGLLN